MEWGLHAAGVRVRENWEKMRLRDIQALADHGEGT